MLVALLGLLTALVNAHMPVGRPPLLQAARTAGWMALLGAPIMVVLFVLFPRFAPLWGIPSDAMSGRSGLSANMQVGNIAKLALDDRHRHAREVRGHPSRRRATCTSAARCCPPSTAANGAPLPRGWHALRRAPAAARCRCRARRCATRSRWSPTTGPGCWCWTRPRKPPDVPGLRNRR